MSEKSNKQNAILKSMLAEALRDIESVMESELWSYTREHELGRLDVAKYAIKAVLDDI